MPPASDSTVAGSDQPAQSEPVGDYPLLGDLPPIGEPNPLDIEFTPDGDRSVTALVGADGATITATAADGTSYTLTVPPEAVIGRIEITLTPLASVDTESLGELSGVLMEPEGLILLRSAELTIETGGDTEGLATAATFAGGKDFHLTWSEASGATLTTSLNHFSLTFVGHGRVLGDIQNSYRPSQGQALFEQRRVQLDATLGPRSSQNAETYDAALVQLFDQWLRSSVLPQLESSRVSPLILDQAIGNALRWKEVTSSWPWDGKDADLAALTQALGAALNAAIERAAIECRTDPESAADMFRYMFLAKDLGVSYSTSLAPACISFTFEMTSTFHTEIQEDGNKFELITTASVAIPVALTFTADEATAALGFGLELKATGPVTLSGDAVASADAGSVICAVSGAGEITVELDISLNLNYAQRGFDRVTAQLELPRSSAPQEKLTCNGQTVTPGAPIWYLLFLQARQVRGAQPIAEIDLDLVTGGSIIAREALSAVIEAPAADESSELRVVHTPG